MEYEVPIRIRIRERQNKQIDRVVEALGLSKSEYIRAAIDMRLAIDTPKGK